jgi:hypothetical protein
MKDYRWLENVEVKKRPSAYDYRGQMRALYVKQATIERLLMEHFERPQSEQAKTPRK